MAEKTFPKWFYRVFNRVAEVRLVHGSADFRLLDRKCVNALNEMDEHFKFFRGQVPYIGFNQVELPFDCPLGSQASAATPCDSPCSSPPTASSPSPPSD